MTTMSANTIRRSNGNDVVNRLALSAKSVAKKNKVTKKKAKASRTKQRMMDNRLDSLEKEMSMVMQSLENQPISMADQRQTIVHIHKCLDAQ